MTLLIGLLSAAGALIVLWAFRTKQIGGLVLSGLAGVAGLVAADLISGLFDFNIPLNALTIGMSAVGGLPGCILVNVMQIIFR
ncbi:MAG: pro-sigmaK processing inhibitor BofA family protein [Clostridia bacterium]|nr:pro-sigmaK processing inhibitor BofA family protein [Clostridia bacterium]MBR0537100.1 pro-sigmaK processing inhibitor BofA family protein [Clostridia bacterium]